MAAMQNTMRLAALLALQSMGGPAIEIRRKVMPIRAGMDMGKWIAQARRYCDEQGRCVEQLAQYRGNLPPFMCRFFGYGDITLDAPGEPQRDVEVQFPISAKTVEEAYQQFDDSFARFVSSLNAGVKGERDKNEKA